jgi:hypothetical protein
MTIAEAAQFLGQCVAVGVMLGGVAVVLREASK